MANARNARALAPGLTSLKAERIGCSPEQGHTLEGRRTQASATGPLNILDEATRCVAEAVVAENFIPPIEILETRIVTESGQTCSVVEGQPFKLQILLQCNKPIPAASVNLNITRLDGVCAFYQPSGLSHVHIREHIGRATVEFDFSVNPFGFGDYEVRIGVCNEWSWDNIPPSEVFDRSFGEFKFSVRLSMPIEFGIIRTQVPVTLVLS